MATTTTTTSNEYPIPFDGICRPINDSWFNRLATVSAVQLLWRYRKYSGRTLFLTENTCIKYSQDISQSEATTLKYIANNTNIPVPKIFCSFTQNGWGYIVMERIKGSMLTTVWPDLSESSRTKILAQLKGHVKQMRRLKPPKDFKGVANVSGGPCSDLRLPRTDNEKFGPFKTIQDFHRWLRDDYKKLPTTDPEIASMIDMHDGEWGDPVFTHGDLSSLNVMVRDDEIVAIIDWEMSGWFPYYWEYTTANQVNDYNLFWREWIDKYLEPMPRELKMERTRNEHFGLTDVL